MSESTYNIKNSTTFPVEEKPTVITGVCKFSQNDKKSVGRPKKTVAWPEGDFTFESALESNSGLSKSSIRNKVIECLKKGTLVKTGKVRTGFGRPKDIYRTNA